MFLRRADSLMFKHLTNGSDGRLELSLASNKGPTHGVIARVISSDICHVQSIRKPEPLRVPIGKIIVLRCDRVILSILISPAPGAMSRSQSTQMKCWRSSRD